MYISGLMLNNNVTLIITIKKVSRKIHQKCPREFTQKEDFSWTKLSTRCHQKCPRKVTHFVNENLPYISTRSLLIYLQNSFCYSGNFGTRMFPHKNILAPWMFQPGMLQEWYISSQGYFSKQTCRFWHHTKYHSEMCSCPKASTSLKYPSQNIPMEQCLHAKIATCPCPEKSTCQKVPMPKHPQ